MNTSGRLWNLRWINYSIPIKMKFMLSKFALVMHISVWNTKITFIIRGAPCTDFGFVLFLRKPSISIQ